MFHSYVKFYQRVFIDLINTEVELVRNWKWWIIASIDIVPRIYIYICDGNVIQDVVGFAGF